MAMGGLLATLQLSHDSSFVQEKFIMAKDKITHMQRSQFIVKEAFFKCI
jgi:hypothetical protein